MSALLSLLTQWLLVFAEFNEKTSGLGEVDEFPGRISQETRGGKRVAAHHTVTVRRTLKDIKKVCLNSLHYPTAGRNKKIMLNVSTILTFERRQQKRLHSR